MSDRGRPTRRERKPSLVAKEAEESRELEALIASGRAPPPPPKSRRGPKPKKQREAEEAAAAAAAQAQAEAGALAAAAAAAYSAPPAIFPTAQQGAAGLPYAVPHFPPQQLPAVLAGAQWQQHQQHHTAAAATTQTPLPAHIIHPQHLLILNAGASGAHGAGATFASLTPEQQATIYAVSLPHLHPPPGSMPGAPPVLPPGGEGAAPGAPPFFGGAAGAEQSALALPLVTPPPPQPPVQKQQQQPRPRVRPAGSSSSRPPLSWPARGWPPGVNASELPRPRLDFLNALPYDAKDTQLINPASVPPRSSAAAAADASASSSSSSSSSTGLLSLPDDLIAKIFDLAFDAAPDDSLFRYESHAAQEVAGLVLSCSRLRALLGPRFRFTSPAVPAAGGGAAAAGSTPTSGADGKGQTDAPPPHSPIPADTWRRVRERQQARVSGPIARHDYGVTDGWLLPLPFVVWREQRPQGRAYDVKMYRRDHMAVAARLRWEGVPQGGAGRQRRAVESWAADSERMAGQVLASVLGEDWGGGAGGGGGAGAGGVQQQQQWQQQQQAVAAGDATLQKKRAAAAAEAFEGATAGQLSAAAAVGKRMAAAVADEVKEEDGGDAVPTKRQRKRGGGAKPKAEAVATAAGAGVAPLPAAPAIGASLGFEGPGFAPPPQLPPAEPGTSVLARVFAQHMGAPPLTSTPPLPLLPPGVAAVAPAAAPALPLPAPVPQPPSFVTPPPLQGPTLAALYVDCAAVHGPAASMRLQELGALFDANNFGTAQQRAQILSAAVAAEQQHGGAGATAPPTVDPMLAPLRAFVLHGATGVEQAYAQFQVDAAAAAHRRMGSG